MAKVTAARLMVLSALGLVMAGTTSIGCGGASGGSRATGGATGAGGSVGSAGTTGGGLGGANGTGGVVACAAINAPLDCPNGLNPAAPLISDWSPATWSNTMGKWHTAACDLTGSIFGGAKPALLDAAAASTMTQAVTFAAPNPGFELKGTILSGEYGYGGMQFDRCVNTTTYTGIQFTLTGTTAGCDLFVYAQTYDQQAISNKGGCAADCYNFPKKQITVDTAPITVHFGEFTGGFPATGDLIKAQIVGLQWQLQSPAGADGGAQPACNDVDITIDDVKFVSD
jgi:hypothetical protein